MLNGCKLLIAGCLGILFLDSCGGATSNGQQPVDSTAKRKEVIDISIPGGFSDQVQLHFDSTLLPAFLQHYPAFSTFKNELEIFYSKRGYAYAWYDKNGLIEQAGNLFNRIMNISDDGLPDKMPYRDSFRVTMDSLQHIDNTKTPHAETELMLTAQYFAYAKIAWQGLSEKDSKALDWYLPRKQVNLLQLMDSLLNDGTAFIADEPVYRQYGLLKKYLKRYRDIETKTGWEAIVPGKKKYEQGDSSQVIAQIRERLFVLGDIESAANNPVYDEGLVKGIKAFQKRLGLKQDGIIGTNFFKEINYPVSKRIEQIIVNMERCRWLPEQPKGDYLAVNIPEFSLHAYHTDSLLWSMNVVVGKAVHETVIFSGELKYVVFSPYWNVPASILQKEILPALKRNPNYLNRQHMEWNGNTVRQKPGANNALGLVKFLFPNSYSIYLHDTPAKSLFEQDKRAFSHGCIRVSKARDLAKWLLRNYPEWTDEKIDKAMSAGKEQYFALKETVPVFIAYFTAWVDREGKLNFREDIYKRDSRLARMIIESPGI
ncbi:MAG: L,D-transpeptidase family protein [Chitinophagales bacterium]|nr:L,D-transpeptidase family protein [Chitinophagales bacterium]